MPDDQEQLREVIRQKIRSGALPKPNCRMTWFGPGSGNSCVACDLAVGLADVEVECDLSTGGTLRFHRSCYERWVAERTACPEARSSSGSGPRQGDQVHPRVTSDGGLMPFTIVVIDDDVQYHEFIAHILHAASDIAIVGYASNGLEGLALVRQERPDIVITDLIMPDFNGVELTRHIRQELPATQVVLISSTTEEAYQFMASDSGADTFVSKRVLFESLLPAVRDVIRRRLSGGSWPIPEAAPECPVRLGHAPRRAS